MGTITHNLRLNVPDFDAAPWDVDVNTNWLVLDATVGMFSAIPNLAGAWKNVTAYSYGQSVIDSADSSIWQCIQAHTSSAAPQSFLQERIAYPGRWTQTTQGAQFYAQQAASSAASAQAAAESAAESAVIAAVALPLAGGTMTGYIVLHADPVANMQPTTKQYVDSRVGGTGYLPLTGGVMTGPLTVGGSGITYGNIVPAEQRAFAFGWNGNPYLSVNGTFVGFLATREYVNGAYLLLTGGSMSGTLYSAGEIQANSTFRIQSSGAYFHSTAAVTTIAWDSGGWQLQYNRSNGTLAYLRGGDSLQLWTVDGAGNSSVRGSFNTTGTIASSSNLYARGGSVFFGAGDRARLQSDNSTYTALSMLDNYMWHLNWSTGALAWVRNDSVALLTIDVVGTSTFVGSIYSNGNIQANSNIAAAAGSMWMGVSGNTRVFQIANEWYWAWDATNGNMFWTTGSGIFFSLRITTNQVGNDRGPIYGLGAYINNSDERGKTIVGPSAYGLDDILKLRPIVFNRAVALTEREEHGFSAQQVREVIPHAVFNMGNPDEETLGVSIDPIVVALVNGMQELSQRIQQLENK